MKTLIRIIPLLLLTPMVTFGAPGELDEVSQFFGNIVTFINNVLVPLIFAFAFLVFLWGIAQYFITGRDAEEAKEKGRDYMIYGILGFVIMVSVWGIVNLVADGFGFRDSEIGTIPDVRLQNN